jgi:hypothetical protein
MNNPFPDKRLFHENKKGIPQKQAISKDPALF